jgi:hypothetical protein
MARVKYVLNERRLGMMAAAQPISDSMSNLVKEIAEGESVVEDEEVAREEVDRRLRISLMRSRLRMGMWRRSDSRYDVCMHFIHDTLRRLLPQPCRHVMNIQH